MSNTVIHSGKMLKSGMKVVCTQGDSKNTKAKAVFEYKDAIPHPDLLKRNRDLVPHFAILCGGVSLEAIKAVGGKGKKSPTFTDKEADEKFRVTGITVTEKSGMLTITGQHLTEYAGWITQNVKVTPPQTEDDDAGYPFIDDLEEKFNLVAAEYAEFIENGKQGEDPQLKLGLPDDEQEPE